MLKSSYLMHLKVLTSNIIVYKKFYSMLNSWTLFTLRNFTAYIHLLIILCIFPSDILILVPWYNIKEEIIQIPSILSDKFMLLFIKYFSDTSDTCLRQQVNPRFYIEELRAEHGIYFLFDYWILYNIKRLNITTN